MWIYILREIMSDFGDRSKTIHGWYACITDIGCFLGC